MSGPVKVSASQLKTIASLAKKKDYTREDVVAKCKEMGFRTLTGGKDGSASRIIDWLIHAPAKEPVKPSIQVEEETDPEIQ